MTKAQRLLSLFFLAGFTLAAAPLASAAEPNDPNHPATLRQELREELKVCREIRSTTERNDCMQAVREKYKDQVKNFGQRVRRQVRRNMPDAVREKFEECNEKETREDKRACMRDIREAAKAKHDSLRDQIKDKCGDLTREDKRACIKEFAEDNGIDLPGHKKRKMRHRVRGASDEVREELRACRELDSREETVECLRDVRQNNRNNQ